MLRDFGYKPWEPYPSVDEIITRHGVEDTHDIDALKYYFSAEPQKAIADANEMKQVYFAQFPLIETFLNNCKARTKSRGYCMTWTGRRRHFKSPKKECYKAANAIIQGGCGDITKQKMYECLQFLQPYKSRMINTIHDAILFEIADDEAEILSDLKAILTDLEFDIPFDCSVEVGYENWAHMKEVTY